MEKKELIDRINTILSEEFEVEQEMIIPQANIKETLELDSLSLVDMVALIDQEFGVKLSGTEVSQLKTFGELYEYLYSKVQL